MKNEATHTDNGKSLGLVNENDNKKSNGKEQLIEYHEVKGTPFTVARNGTEWFVLMGKYRFTENMGTRIKATREANAMTWTKIMQVIQVMITDNENEKNKNSQITSTSSQQDNTNKID